MVNIKLESGGFLLENKVLFWATVPHKNYINLAFDAGEDIVRENVPYSMVEFPGEYDIQNIIIKALLWKDNKLNYLVTLKNKKYGIIQNPKILDEDEVGNMDYRLYLDDNVEKKIDQLELDWKKIRLDAENGVLEVDMKDDKSHSEVDVKSSNTQWDAPEVDVD